MAGATTDGMLDLGLDPKLAWALRHRERFPVDVNTAPRETLLRVPGLGVRAVDGAAQTRAATARCASTTCARLTTSVRKIRPFVAALDWHPGASLDAPGLAARLQPAPRQLSLFAA